MRLEQMATAWRSHNGEQDLKKGKWKSRTRADTDSDADSDSDSDSDTNTAKNGKGRHRLECQDMQACPLSLARDTR